MFLKNAEQITDTINKVHFAILELPNNLTFPNIPKAINISPNDKNHISVEEIHQIEKLVRTKQSIALIIAVNHAERMTEQAQNCFLKLLEEPGSHIHFVFFTHHASKLLSTVRSRAHIFYLKNNSKLDSPLEHDGQIVALAKQYISSTPQQLVSFSQNLAKDRDKALDVISVAIELLYKSYFKTGNSKFLDKLSTLIQAYDNISKNGHVRLQLVASMV